MRVLETCTHSIGSRYLPPGSACLHFTNSCTVTGRIKEIVCCSTLCHTRLIHSLLHTYHYLPHFNYNYCSMKCDTVMCCLCQRNVRATKFNTFCRQILCICVVLKVLDTIFCRDDKLREHVVMYVIDRRVVTYLYVNP